MAKSSYEKPDFWTQKAKKEGYPARSIYKLEEINEKFRLLKKNMHILDIGAAPGSWSLWVLRKFKSFHDQSMLVSVDLSDLTIPKDKPNFHFIQGDIFSDVVQKQLITYGPFDLILSDAAPATTGNSTVDTSRSEELVRCVLDLSAEHLKTGGALVCKFFIGGGQQELLSQAKSTFKTVRTYKPEACRTSSFETYLIAQQKL